MGKKKIVILGSTGSVGRQTLEALELYRDRFEVIALAAGSNAQLLAKQAAAWRPRYAALAAGVMDVSELPSGTEYMEGQDAAEQLVKLPEADIVLNSIVGVAGLSATFAAACAGKVIALANKESLVAGGELVMEAVRRNGAKLLPVDSEHSAIFQCMQGLKPEDVSELWITASGGPFLHTPQSELEQVTPAQALRHPRWDMGPKISIDSATLMNKGLEVIEAHHLFGIAPQHIHAVIHPQSVVHGLVHTRDGAMLAQCGAPDMRIPIMYALTYPQRWTTNAPSLQLAGLSLTFDAPDSQRFPCLQLAYDALAMGGTAPAVLNAANEVAVGAFLQNRIGFLDIPRLVREVLEQTPVQHASKLEDIFYADAQARRLTEEVMYG